MLGGGVDLDEGGEMVVHPVVGGDCEGGAAEEGGVIYGEVGGVDFVEEWGEGF